MSQPVIFLIHNYFFSSNFRICRWLESSSSWIEGPF